MSRSDLDLGQAWEIRYPTLIEVSRKGIHRPPRLPEALSLALGSLATLGDLSGVRVMNAIVNDQPTAIAILDGAKFIKDQNGFTVLTEAAGKENT